MEYISLDTIFAKIYRDLKPATDISENDMIEWAAEALEAIGAHNQYEQRICCMEVKNHRAELPKGLKYIVQVAKDNFPDQEVCPNDLCTEALASQCSCKEAEECDACCGNVTTAINELVNPVVIDCKGTPVTDFEVAYYRPFYDLKWEHEGWMGSSRFREHYTPVRLSTHSFFDSLVCGEAEGLYTTCEHEYSIEHPYIKTSFEEGQICIAYMACKLDGNNLPMIPDHYSYKTAITTYITLMIMKEEFYKGRQGAGQRMQKAEQDWHYYCAQARNRARMPKTIDEFKNLRDQRNHMLPRNEYYGFFGNLNAVENRAWNRRRRHAYYSR